MRVRNNQAFTLVELLVVIGIIAVLIAILLPALQRVRSSARSIVCLSRLRECHMAFQMYATENKGWISAGGHLQTSSLYTYGWVYWLTPNTYNESVFNVTGRYLTDIRVTGCTEWTPSVMTLAQANNTYGINADPDQLYRTDAVNGKRVSGVRVWYHPSNTSSNRRFFFYRLNPPPPATRAKNRPLQGGRTSPILLADTLDSFGWWPNGGHQVYSFELDHEDPINANNNQVHARHNDRLNCVFFDGHAESVQKEHLYELGVRDYFWGLRPVRLSKWDNGAVTIIP